MTFKKLKHNNSLEKSENKSNNLIRDQISYSINGNKIKEMLIKIEEPMEYINAITKLLPYVIGKKKAVDEQDLDNDRVRIIHVNIEGKEI